jgi:hypothetical protein
VSRCTFQVGTAALLGSNGHFGKPHTCWGKFTVYCTWSGAENCGEAGLKCEGKHSWLNGTTDKVCATPTFVPFPAARQLTMCRSHRSIAWRMPLRSGGQATLARWLAALPHVLCCVPGLLDGRAALCFGPFVHEAAVAWLPFMMTLAASQPALAWLPFHSTLFHEPAVAWAAF